MTGSTTIISREAPRASSTTPATTISSRSVIAEATARPRGTASSPLRNAGGAGGWGRPLGVGRRVSTGALAIVSSE